MGLDNNEIRRYASLKMKRLKVAKRWYDIVCGCCADDWEEVEMVITFQGVIEFAKKALTGFFLFTTEFRYDYGWQTTG